MQQSTAIDEAVGASLPINVISALLDSLDTPFLVASRSGRILIANGPAKRYLDAIPVAEGTQLNLFTDLLHLDPKVVASYAMWGVYVLLLLVRRTAGLRGRRAAYLSGAVLAFMLAVWAANLVSHVHRFGAP